MTPFKQINFEQYGFCNWNFDFFSQKRESCYSIIDMEGFGDISVIFFNQLSKLLE